VLLADYKGYRRLSHLKYVPLPGGDASVLRPYRMAMAHMWAAGMTWDSDVAPVRACPSDEQRVLAHQLETGLGCAPTSSMGRLFDTVASLVGIRQVVAYEAQAAIELEGMSRDAGCGTTTYQFTIDTTQAPAVIDPAPVVAAVIADVRSGVDAGVVGARFHRAVADLIVLLATTVATDAPTIALSGGVFQNSFLLRLTLRALRNEGFEVITHRFVPPNDGGIALGQLMVGNSS
jgi:hydrogenase maturation protein HypF